MEDCVARLLGNATEASADLQSEEFVRISFLWHSVSCLDNKVYHTANQKPLPGHNTKTSTRAGSQLYRHLGQVRRDLLHHRHRGHAHPLLQRLVVHQFSGNWKYGRAGNATRKWGSPYCPGPGGGQPGGPRGQRVQDVVRRGHRLDGDIFRDDRDCHRRQPCCLLDCLG